MPLVLTYGQGCFFTRSELHQRHGVSFVISRKLGYITDSPDSRPAPRRVGRPMQITEAEKCTMVKKMLENALPAAAVCATLAAAFAPVSAAGALATNIAPSGTPF